jgi:hypothetical protein
MGFQTEGLTSAAEHSPLRGAVEGFRELDLPNHLSLDGLISIVETVRQKQIKVDVSEPSLGQPSVGCGCPLTAWRSFCMHLLRRYFTVSNSSFMNWGTWCSATMRL